MALETGSFISDLVATNPTSTDPKSEGDNHLRLIKSTVKATFPNVTGAVTKTHTQLNNTLDKTGDTMTGPLAQAAGTAALPSYTFSGDTNTGMWSPGADRVGIATAGVQRVEVDASGNVLVTGSGGLGYGVGSGGAVTQATNKSTTVVLNKPSGTITMNNAALGSGAVAEFQFTNSALTSVDGLVLVPSGFAGYRVEVRQMAAGFCILRVVNVSAGSLSDALQINFAVIKTATS